MDNARPTSLSRAITEAGPKARRFCRASGVLCGLWSTAPEWPLHDAGLQPGGVPGPEASGVAGSRPRPSWGFLEASIDFDPADNSALMLEHLSCHEPSASPRARRPS